MNAHEFMTPEDRRETTAVLERLATAQAINAGLIEALEKIARGNYDNAHDPKRAARIALAAIAKARGEG